MAATTVEQPPIDHDTTADAGADGHIDQMVEPPPGPEPPLAIGSGNTTGSDAWFSTGDVIGVAAIIGVTIGSITGTVIGLTKKKDKYTINGDTDKWRKLRNKLVWAE